MQAERNEGLRVLLSSLEVEGAKPEAGDEVEFEGSGKVLRIEGDEAIIELTSINGEPLKKEEVAPEEASEEGSEEEELDALKREMLGK